jgi:hypothetical protein
VLSYGTARRPPLPTAPSNVGKSAKDAKVANTHPAVVREIGLRVCKALKVLKMLNTHHG